MQPNATIRSLSGEFTLMKCVYIYSNFICGSSISGMFPDYKEKYLRGNLLVEVKLLASWHITNKASRLCCWTSTPHRMFKSFKGFAVGH